MWAAPLAVGVAGRVGRGAEGHSQNGLGTGEYHTNLCIYKPIYKPVYMTTENSPPLTKGGTCWQRLWRWVWPAGSGVELRATLSMAWALVSSTTVKPLI